MNLLEYACIFAMLCFCAAALMATFRLMRGPTPQDRVIGSDFLTMNAVMIFLTLGVQFNSAWYFDISLLMSLIGFVSSAALAKFLLRGEIIEP